MTLPTTQIQTWTKDSFFISTDPSLIPLADLNKALASDQMHWAVELTDSELEVMINTSVCFGLYHVHHPVSQDTTNTNPPPPPSLIGLARLITDRITFAYLTDVYVLPTYEGRGLGTWLMDCVKDYINLIPKLRQFVLITGKGKKEEYYARKFGTSSIERLKETIGVFVARGPSGSFDS